MDLRAALNKHFGFNDFREGQEEIIQNVIQGENVLAVMHTSAGKSMCYQLPALMMKGQLTIVVSPLISLMQDQVEKLIGLGITAGAINSSSSYSAKRNIFNLISRGELPLLYVTPERIENAQFLGDLLRATESNPIARIVMDEAHCISMWGHDFRKSYGNVNVIRRTLESILTKRTGKPFKIPVSLFTATASKKVLNDLTQNIFGDLEFKTFLHSPKRNNLTYKTQVSENEAIKMSQLISILNSDRKAHDGSTIIYCATIKQVDAVSQRLLMSQFDTAIYHGSLPAPQRLENQTAWMKGEKKIIVATTAFGMGIDKSDVRHIIHYAIPSSIDDYHQESGRGGRDNKPTTATLLFSEEDVRVRRIMIDTSHPPKPVIQAVMQYIFAIYKADGNIPMTLNNDVIAKAVGNDVLPNAITTVIKELKDCNFLEYEHETQTYSIKNVKSQPDYELIERQRLHQHTLLDQITSYATTEKCKENYLLSYYNFEEDDDCGKCSSCLSQSVSNTLVKDTIDAALTPIEQKERILDELTKLRTKISKSMKLPPFSVMTEGELKSITEIQPISIAELIDIKGMTTRKIEVFGADIINCVIPYTNRKLPEMTFKHTITDGELEQKFKEVVNKEVRMIRKAVYSTIKP